MAAGYDPGTWDSILESTATKYGLDPNLLKAIARQENVNPAHNNPLGLSTNTGVKSFSDMPSAIAAIESQARLLTNPNGPYKDFAKSGDINDLAKVYSPVGAVNDIYGTNAGEASGIVAQLRKLKGQSPIAAGTGTTSLPLGSLVKQVPTAPAVAGTVPTTPGTSSVNEMNTLLALQKAQQSETPPSLTSTAGIQSLLNSIYKQGQQLNWWGAPRAQLVQPTTVAQTTPPIYRGYGALPPTQSA